jgi:hypothetical protein
MDRAARARPGDRPRDSRGGNRRRDRKRVVVDVRHVLGFGHGEARARESSAVLGSNGMGLRSAVKKSLP